MNNNINNNNNDDQLTISTVNGIFNDALTDPSLLSTIDIDKLLSSVDMTNGMFGNKTSEMITTENYEIIDQLNIPQSIKLKYANKLNGYHSIDQINEFIKGRHIRWYRDSTKQLTNGGILMDIKFLDNGIHILCMNAMRRFIQYKFDDCISFQKLSNEEQIILSVAEYIVSD